MLLVDGRARGQTPASLTDLHFGEHTVEIAHSGFVPRTERVTLTAHAPSRVLSIQLQPGIPTATNSTPLATGATESGSVFIDSRPQAARVIIDGYFLGVTPLRVPSVRTGAHEVRLERTGYRAFLTVIGVKAGEQARVTAALDERRDDQ